METVRRSSRPRSVGYIGHKRKDPYPSLRRKNKSKAGSSVASTNGPKAPKSKRTCPDPNNIGQQRARTPVPFAQQRAGDDSDETSESSPPTSPDSPPLASSSSTTTSPAFLSSPKTNVLVYVAPSRLGPSAGLGLFAKTTIPANQYICLYQGERIRKSQYLKRYSDAEWMVAPYLVMDLDGNKLDGWNPSPPKPDPLDFGRYANDCTMIASLRASDKQQPVDPNFTINHWLPPWIQDPPHCSTNADIDCWKPNERSRQRPELTLISNTIIYKGEEIFTAYGANYWGTTANFIRGCIFRWMLLQPTVSSFSLADIVLAVAPVAPSFLVFRDSSSDSSFVCSKTPISTHSTQFSSSISFLISEYLGFVSLTWEQQCKEIRHLLSFMSPHVYADIGLPNHYRLANLVDTAFLRNMYRVNSSNSP